MILCPSCGTRTNVYDSRISFEGNTRRKRLCPSCSFRFATIEVLDTGRPLETRQPKAPQPKKVRHARVAKKTAPKREPQQKKKPSLYEEDNDADSFVDDFEDVVRELGIGGLNEYD